MQYYQKLVTGYSNQILDGLYKTKIADIQIYHNFSGGFKSADMLETLCHDTSGKIRVLPLGVGLQEQASKTAQAAVAKSHGGDRLENGSGI